MFSKSSFTGLVLWLALICAPAALVADAPSRTYTVGVVPQFEARTLHEVWRAVLDRVEAATGYRFSLRGSPTIPDFEREFKSGRFDFAYMNPYHFVMANEQAGYIPLVRDQGQTLYGVLVVREDSPIQSPVELAGRRVAFPAPNALGAALQMRQELEDRFAVEVEPVYVETHDSVYLSVLLGEAAAGGGVQKTLDRQRPEYREALRVIHTTTPVAPHPFAALPGVPEAVRERVRQAFLELGESDEGRAALARIPMTRVGPAATEDYLPLLEMKLERYYVSP